MNKKALIFLFLLFAFSAVLSTDAVPSSRSLRSTAFEDHKYHEMKMRARIDVGLSDYEGPGANNHHDPKSPPGTS